MLNLLRKFFIQLFFMLLIISNANAITFNFKDADIKDVIEGFALMVGKSFIIDSRVTGKVNVISQEEISIEQAEDMMHSILQVHGFVMQEINGKIKILPDQLMRENSIYSEDSSILPSDKIVTQLIKLENIPVNDFVSAIRPIIPKESSLIPYLQSNSLIITSNAFSIQKIERIVQKIDEPNLTETEIIKIENLNALDVAKVLNRFFSERDPGSARNAFESKQAFTNFHAVVFRGRQNISFSLGNTITSRENVSFPNGIKHCFKNAAPRELQNLCFP